MKRKMLFALFGVLLMVVIGASTLVIAPSEPVRNPQRNSSFGVEIDGVAAGGFSSVEGIVAETEVLEYRAGDDSNMVRLAPGLTESGPLVLKRVLSSDSALYDWHASVTDYNFDRRAVSVIFYDHGHQEVSRINFFECWPSSYYIEPLESNPSNVAYEVIVIQFEWMEWA
jgi:phage tail-like protein